MLDCFDLDLRTTHVAFLDTEFTDLDSPRLLSLGLVSKSGGEHYVELDLAAPENASVLDQACDFVRDGGVLEQWGRVAGAATSYRDMGLRTAAWLRDRLAERDDPLQIACDYQVDFALLEQLLRDAGQWDDLGSRLQPLDVIELTSRLDGFLGAGEAREAMRRRGLERHHALVDAHALRAACIAAVTGRGVRL